MSSNGKQPSPESSATLRALIEWKHKQGQVAEALVLARLARRIFAHERISKRRDELSRVAMARYLQVVPEDKEVQQALRQIGPPKPPLSLQRFLAWTLFIVGGLSAAASIHAYGLPLPEPPAPPAPILIVLPQARPAAVVPVAEDTTPIVIRAVGDIVLGSDFPVRRLPGAKDKERMALLRHNFSSADIVIGNLEGVLHDKGMPRKDTAQKDVYAFRMPQSYAAILRDMGFHVLSLANNHSLDFGHSGLQSTLQALRTEGIQPMGVPGAEMAVVKVRNTSVAFLGYSYVPAFARLDDEARIKEDIRHARSAANLVVVTVHGGKGAEAQGAPAGDEYYRGEYRGDLRKFAYLAVDAGASAVFGHGPHVVRPYETYQGKPIFYSLGNFIGYDSLLSTRGKLASSIIAEVRFSPKGKLLGTGVIPLKLDHAGIPLVDYSATTLQTLDGLLDEELDKRPVLPIARGRAGEDKRNTAEDAAAAQ
jgi:hypothetical protein